MSNVSSQGIIVFCDRDIRSNSLKLKNGFRALLCRSLRLVLFISNSFFSKFSHFVSEAYLIYLFIFSNFLHFASKLFTHHDVAKRVCRMPPHLCCIDHQLHQEKITFTARQKYYGKAMLIILLGLDIATLIC